MGSLRKVGNAEKEKDIKRREKEGMRKSGRWRKADPSRRYIGIGVSHYKGVFHRIFKYSYSLPSGAIHVGEGGFTTEEAEIWVKTEHTMLFCCHWNDAATQRWNLQQFHHKKESVFIF